MRPPMNVDRHARTSARAYEIWEREGRPEGKDQAHWEHANRELAADDATNLYACANEPASPPDPDKQKKSRALEKPRNRGSLARKK